MEEGILNLIYIEIVLPNKLRPAKNRQASHHSQTEKVALKDNTEVKPSWWTDLRQA